VSLDIPLTEDQIAAFCRAYRAMCPTHPVKHPISAGGTGSVRIYSCRACGQELDSESAKYRPTKHAEKACAQHVASCARVAALIAKGEKMPSGAALAATGVCIYNGSADRNVEYRVCYRLPDGTYLSGTRRKDVGGDQGPLFGDAITKTRPRWA